MSRKNETVILFLSLIITGGIIAAGYWWFTRKSEVNFNSAMVTSSTTQNHFPPPINVPSGTTIMIDGSTSMVTINETFKKAFLAKFPQTRIFTQARGTDEGIKSLLNGQIDIAAISRFLTPQEQSQGLKAIPISQDAIAIMVGFDNPICRKGLTEQQVKDIFQGKLTDWSQIGREGGLIKVINRPPISGTHQTFKELVLRGKNFGITNNILTKDRDETTGIIQELGKDGISYATYQQVVNQSKACALAINGLTPQTEQYPYLRILYYAYKEPANEGVKAFLGFINSPEAQNLLLK